MTARVLTKRYNNGYYEKMRYLPTFLEWLHFFLRSLSTDPLIFVLNSSWVRRLCRIFTWGVGYERAKTQVVGAGERQNEFIFFRPLSSSPLEENNSSSRKTDYEQRQTIFYDFFSNKDTVYVSAGDTLKCEASEPILSSIVVFVESSDRILLAFFFVVSKRFNPGWRFLNPIRQSNQLIPIMV